MNSKDSLLTTTTAWKSQQSFSNNCFDPLSIALNSISHLVSCLNQKHYSNQVSQLQRIVEEYGFECERHLFRLLFSSLISSQGTSTSSPESSLTRRQLLKQLYQDLGSLWSRKNYTSLIQFCLKESEGESSVSDSVVSSSRGSTPSGTTTTSGGDKRRGSGSSNTSASTSSTDLLRSETPQTEAEVISLVDKVNSLCSSLNFKEEEKLCLLISLFAVNHLTFLPNNINDKNHQQRLRLQQLLSRVIFEYAKVDLEKCHFQSTFIPVEVRHFLFSHLLSTVSTASSTKSSSEAEGDSQGNKFRDLIRKIAEALEEEIPSLGNRSEEESLRSSILFSAASLDIINGDNNRSENNNRTNLNKTGIDIADLLVNPIMSTNHPPNSSSNLTDDQITAMLINETGPGVVLTSDMLRPFDVTPRLCAKLLFAICKTGSKSGGSSATSMEEIDALANICREFLPSASPLTDIIRCLDSDSFIPLNDRVVNLKMAGKGFTRFLHFCLSLCNTDKQGVSLLASLFFSHLWSVNIEFQFGFVVSCVRLNVVPKLLSGSGSSSSSNDSLGQLVPQIDALKCQPDLESFPDIANWRFQKLYQILLDALSSQSNVSSISTGSLFYPIVIELMKSPLNTAPDLMALGILGCSGHVTQIRKDLLSLTIPSFLGNHPNSAIILHLMWNQTDGGVSSSLTTVPAQASQSNWGKQVLLQSMCDHYMKSPVDEQQSRLSRILDVAQDLKALSLLLNSSCYPFVIDLACLASRREYLKLDKWLLDKINSNGEAFVQATIGFLNKRCPALLAGAKVLEPGVPPTLNLPSENLATLLACLHHTITGNTSSGLSKHVNDEILTMVSNSSLLLHNRSVPSLASMASSSTTSSSTGSLTSKLSSLPQTSSQMRAGAPVGIVAPTIPVSSSAHHDSLSGLANLSISGQQRPPFGNPLNAPQMASSLPGVPSSQNTIGGSLMSQQSQQQPQTSDMRAVFGDLARVFPEMQQNVSPEIEKEADTYFQRIYNHSGPQSMTIDEVLEMLKRFQDSPNQREKEIFTCMIRNLFKEYGYFPQYPDKELLITAQLFGGIIQMGLVKYMALVLALRYVLEALRKPHRSKMYFFGIAALDRFKSKLKDYPLYCQHLTSIAHFEEFPAVLIEYVRFGAQSLEPPSTGRGGTQPTTTTTTPFLPTAMDVLPPSSQTMLPPPSATTNPIVAPASITRPSSSAVGSGSTTAKPSIAAADIATLLAAGESVSHQTPPEAIQDKVAFIINNLSQMNLQQKTEEFKEVILKDGDIYYCWIAQYFVMKRASIELNFHNLYANFLDVLSINEITRLIIRETFRNIKVLLRSSKEAENFSDRSLLKNLGHWLGMLTLAKSKPILAIDLDIKKLLIEAYHKSNLELLWVVPFIAKILESTAKSKVFKPPNPWTMGILQGLVELHQEPSLKLNLKFEVEVLCKTLSQDMHELMGLSNCLARIDLRDRVLAEPQLGSKVTAPQLPSVGPNRDGLDSAFQGTPASMSGDSSESLVPKRPVGQVADAGRANASPPNQMPVPVIPSPGVHVFNYHDINVGGNTSLAQLVVVPNNVALFHSQPALTKYVRVSIERAISEWVTPVIERSMKIAIITAEKIIRKDFALEADEMVVCRAAHHLIRSLTAGMSMITAKEPLFMSIMGNLMTAFSRAGTNVSKEMIETAAHTTASENIDLACCFVQKSAVEKATIELDKRLAQDYEVRRKTRAEGRRWCDPNTLAFQVERMPEQIRLHVGSVPPQNLQVYEEIGRNVPGFNSPITEPPGSSLNQALTQLQQQAQAAQAAAAAQRAALNNFESEHQVQQQTQQPAPTDSGLIVLYDKLVTELENLADQLRQHQQPPQLIATMLQILQTVSVARSNPRDIVGAMSLIQRVLDALQDLHLTVESIASGADPSPHSIHGPLTTRARDLYLVILKALADPRAYGQQWTTKQITRNLLERLLTQQTSSPLPDELFEILMKSGLINLSLLDATLAQYIEQAQSPVALAFTFQFLKMYGPQGLHETDVPRIIMALVNLSKSNSSQSLVMEIQQILEVFQRNPAAATTGLIPQEGQTRAADHTFSDHHSENDFAEKTERLLREWITMYYSPQHDINKFFSAYVQQMNLHGILKTDDSITRFFQHSTELCVDFCFRLLTHSSSASVQSVVEIRSKCFHTLDAFAHLILMLVKHSGSNAGTQLESSPKISLLNKVLGIIANVCIADQEAKNESFQHLPYYRILIILFVELTLGCHNLGLPIHQMSGAVPTDPLVEAIQFQVLTAFCQTLRAIRPSKCPSFAYAWLDFISHRTFLEKCLHGVVAGSTKGWHLYAQLLMELIKFLTPFLRCVEMSTPVELLYKGSLKLLLVLLHDFPEFLCEFCFDFCDVIPCNAIQMRNLILSAFPRSMRLPDPFTPNLKIDQLPDITLIPKGIQSTLASLVNVPFKKDLDSYLRTRSPVTFLSELRGHLQLSSGQVVSSDMAAVAASTGSRYNVPLMNALVLYVGQTAIQSITARHINMSTISHSSHMDIFQNLAVDLDSEGRYLFLNAITNQLRYPNAFTHYFSCALLYLFAESNTQAIQEQITRVLLERLIVNRPHPWGLLVTFIELIKNPGFKFWSHDFVRCAPEIEKLFESVAKSCIQNSSSLKQGQQGTENNPSLGQQQVQ